jgi:hypothetical protein
MGMNNAALTARIESVYTALKAAPGSTAAHVQEALGWRHLPVWEIEQLQAQQRIRRLANTPGVHCVDGRYEVAR